MPGSGADRVPHPGRDRHLQEAQVGVDGCRGRGPRGPDRCRRGPECVHPLPPVSFPHDGRPVQPGCRGGAVQPDRAQGQIAPDDERSTDHDHPRRLHGQQGIEGGARGGHPHRPVDP
ncbi:hypothetical protein ACFFX0_13360 [Citricoccus parietis]|uniref:Uncharacterized protein n=1 Tax=Citricoccus parietis TaxID=592307 RepID=A0ABV5FZL7_9MICC